MYVVVCDRLLQMYYVVVYDRLLQMYSTTEFTTFSRMVSASMHFNKVDLLDLINLILLPALILFFFLYL